MHCPRRESMLLLLLLLLLMFCQARLAFRPWHLLLRWWVLGSGSVTA